MGSLAHAIDVPVGAVIQVAMGIDSEACGEEPFTPRPAPQQEKMPSGRQGESVGMDPAPALRAAPKHIG
jgi:hypothetical protein